MEHAVIFVSAVALLCYTYMIFITIFKIKHELYIVSGSGPPQIKNSAGTPVEGLQGSRMFNDGNARRMY
jgi:hypothetical protein